MKHFVVVTDREVDRLVDHHHNLVHPAAGLGGREEEVALDDQAAGAGMVMRLWIPWWV